MKGGRHRIILRRRKQSCERRRDAESRAAWCWDKVSKYLVISDSSQRVELRALRLAVLMKRRGDTGWANGTALTLVVRMALDDGVCDVGENGRQRLPATCNLPPSRRSLFLQIRSDRTIDGQRVAAVNQKARQAAELELELKPAAADTSPRRPAATLKHDGCAA